MKAYVIALIFLMSLSAFSQSTSDFEIKLSNPGKPCSLFIKPFYSSVYVEGYSGNSIAITFGDSGQGNENKSEDFLFDMYEENNQVSILKRPSGREEKLSIHLRVPFNCSLKINAHFATVIKIDHLKSDLKIESHTARILVDDVIGNIEASSFNGNLELTNISGSAILSSGQGDIDASFNSLAPETPLAFSNTHGNITVKLPENVKATLLINNIKGKVNCNFNLEMGNRAKNDSFGSKGVLRLINGGGTWMSFENLRGNIFILKK